MSNTPPAYEQEELIRSGPIVPRSVNRGPRTPEGPPPHSPMRTPPAVADMYEDYEGGVAMVQQENIEQAAKGFFQRLGDDHEGIMQKVLGRIAQLEEAVLRGERATNDVSTKMALLQERNGNDWGYFARKSKELADLGQQTKYHTENTLKMQQELREDNKSITSKLLKLEALTEDTRQLILQSRYSPVFNKESDQSHQEYPPSPSPSQAHRSRTPIQQHEEAQGSHDQVNEVPCPFCDIPNHKPEDCEAVPHYQDRRTMVTSKDKCFKCLAARHEDNKDCPKANQRCSKCAGDYYQDPQNPNCQHHISLCDKRSRGSQKRAASQGPPPPHRGYKGSRNNFGNRRGGFRGYN